MRSNTKITDNYIDTLIDIVREDYEEQKKDGYESYLDDVTTHGCQSGVVTGLIYYDDTLKFYNEYQREIYHLLQETMDGCGVSNPKDLFGKNWDETDPFAQQTANQNLLCWFAYEEAAHRLLAEFET